MKKAKIYYYRFPTMPSKAEKLQLIKDTKFDDIPFERITPDEKGNWINQTDNDFQSLIPLCAKDVKLGRSKEAIFELFSNGVSTNRDEWVYDFSKENLEQKIRFFLKEYNSEVDRWIEWKKKNNYQDTEGESSPTVDRFIHERNLIKWSKMIKRDKLRKHKKEEFDSNNIRKVLYRPFTTKYLYFGYVPIDLKGEFISILQQANQVISISGTSQKPFHTLISDCVLDLHFTGDTVAFPFYRYDNGERTENITDWGLSVFSNQYSVNSNQLTVNSEQKNVTDNCSLITEKLLTKKDIFHYIYAVLHSPDYRKKYELDLKREFPRIPLYADFWKYAEAGEKLMELHLNYELEITNYEPFLERKDIELAKFLEKLRGKKKEKDLSDKEKTAPFEQEAKEPTIKINPILKIKEGNIEIDELTMLCGVPAEALAYKLGNRSAIEWVLDQYKPYKSDDKTIQEQFNNYDFADYKEEVIELLQKVCYVSVETMKIIESL